jgi:hypothetical protein
MSDKWLLAIGVAIVAIVAYVAYDTARKRRAGTNGPATGAITDSAQPTPQIAPTLGGEIVPLPPMGDWNVLETPTIANEPSLTTTLLAPFGLIPMMTADQASQRDRDMRWRENDYNAYYAAAVRTGRTRVSYRDWQVATGKTPIYPWNDFYGTGNRDALNDAVTIGTTRPDLAGEVVIGT